MSTLMLDTIHQTVKNIPGSTRKVAGYLTGTKEIRWTSGDFDKFPHAGHVTIDQGHGTDHKLAKVLDVEQGAATPADAATWALARKADGLEFSDIYASTSRVPAIVAALKGAGGGAGWFIGHVRFWIADWSLTEAEAEALLGTHMGEIEVVSVQFASPSSNPGTKVPGSDLTLKEANIDLSVTNDGWHAAPGHKPPPPKPPATIDGIVTFTKGGKFEAAHVKSTDGAKTWH